MNFDYGKLRGKIREICGSESAFCEKLGLGRTSLSQRLNNRLEFSQVEIHQSCEILGIKKADIPTYFFTPDVQKDEQNEGGKIKQTSRAS